MSLNASYMRINWFSPLPPARTDIANFSARIIPALACHADVQVWVPQDRWETSFRTAAVASALQKRLPWTEISFRDHSIFQIGNDVRFHGALVDIYEQHGGVLVLHDTNVHEMQRMRFVESRRHPEGYLALLARAGGPEAVALGRSVLRGEGSVEEAASRYPLTESLLDGAHGVVLHNPTQLETVAKLTAAPCLYLPLPYSAPEDLPPVRVRDRKSDAPLRMVMFGFLHGANRRLEPVLQAWSSFPMRERLRLELFGDYDRPNVQRLLDELNLRDLVELHGFCDESSMSAILDRADVALNLRYPSRGEASGSLLRIWSHALPCLVSRDGYYGVLDDELVTKIDPRDETNELHHHWKELLTNPAPYLAQGMAGRRHLETHHSPDAYVETLVGFLGEVERYRPRAYLERWVPRMAQKHIAPMPHWIAQKHWQKRIGEELGTWLH